MKVNSGPHSQLITFYRQKHTHTLTGSVSLSLSQTHVHTHTFENTHTCTHILSVTHTQTHRDNSEVNSVFKCLMLPVIFQH